MRVGRRRSVVRRRAGRAIRSGALAGVLVLVGVLAAAPLRLTDATWGLPAGIVAAVVVGAIWWTRGAVRATHRREAARTRRAYRALRDELRGRLAEIESEVRLATLGAPYPLPFEMGWAVTPDAAVLLAQEIAQLRPRLVLELGSGVTTLVTGLMLHRLGGGRIIALEHDPVWAARTRRHIAALGLEDVATVVDAPLVEYELDGQSYRWYTIPPDLDDGSVDFVIVDGPPQHVDRQGSPRYPALPLLMRYLSPAASLFVDDASRDAEKSMVERWSREFAGWAKRRIATRKGAVVISRLPPASTVADVQGNDPVRSGHAPNSATDRDVRTAPRSGRRG